MSAGVCPCCGQVVRDGDALVVSMETNTASRLGRTVHLTPRMAEILAVLDRRYPGQVGTDGLIAAVYGHREEPKTAYTALKVHISYLRRRMAPLGVGVEVVYKTGWRLQFSATPIATAARQVRRRRHAEAA